MVIAIIVLIIIFVISVMMCLTYYVKWYQEKLISQYYKTHLERIICGDNIVSESFAVICEAFGVEEGDLRDYICTYQKEKEK